MPFALALAACGPKAGTNAGDQTFSGQTSTNVDTNAFDENGPAEAKPPVLTFPQEAFRDQQPAAKPPRPLQLPEVQTFKLGGQVDVYLVEKHTLPTISADLNFEGGSINDPSNKTGMVGACMALMGESTTTLEKLQLQEKLANIASSISTYAGKETQGARMSTLTKNIDATLSLFADVLRKPGLREADLKRLIKRRIDAIKQAKAAAPSVAFRVMGSIAYGPRHPFGRISTPAALQSVKVSDCKRYIKSYIKPRGAKLYVVGDMTKDQVIAKFGPLFKSWRGTPKRSIRVGKPQTRKGKIFFVNIPKSAQSAILVHQFGPKRTDRDYFATEMMAATLGAGFSSRINMNLREDKGYAYGAGMRFNYSRHFSDLMGFSTVRSNATRQSVLEFFREIRNLKSGEQPTTAKELSRDQNGAILSLPGQFANSRSALARYRNLVYLGLPLNYYNSYVEGVSSVTLEKVRQMATKHLHPNEAFVLIVGDGDSPQLYRNTDGKDVPFVDDKGAPVTLRSAVEQLAASGELGRGGLVVLDADGNIVK